MPTRDGDIVITHNDRGAFDVWEVSEDGQQQPGPDTHTSRALGRPAALKLGRMMARDSRGALFILEQGGASWTEI